MRPAVTGGSAPISSERRERRYFEIPVHRIYDRNPVASSEVTADAVET